MAHLNIRIDLDNAAFDGADCGAEVSAILQKVAMAVDGSSRADLHDWSKRLRDHNGNACGSAEVEMLVYEIDETLYDEAHGAALSLEETQMLAFLSDLGVSADGLMTKEELADAIAEAVVMGDATIEDIEAVTQQSDLA